MGGVKIILVEDNPLNIELVTDLLQTAGHEVLATSKAEEGLAMARIESPDVILMDIALIGMDGLSATRMLKEDPATASIPVIALTAHAMRGDEEKALRAGCVAYIAKPINTRTFVDIVTTYARASKPHEEE